MHWDNRFMDIIATLKLQEMFKDLNGDEVILTDRAVTRYVSTQCLPQRKRVI